MTGDAGQMSRRARAAARRRRRGAALVVAITLVLAGCSSGDDDGGGATTAEGASRPARTETALVHPVGLEAPLPDVGQPAEPAWTLDEPGTARAATADEDAVYVLLETPSAPRLVAADRADGTPRWASDLDLALGSGATIASPVIMATAALVDEVVVVALYGQEATAVIGVDRTSGDQTWSVDGVGMPILGRMADGDLSVLFRGGESELAVIDQTTGEVALRATGRAVATDGTRVFTADAEGSVEAFDTSGESLWRTDAPEGSTPYAMTATPEMVVVRTALGAQAYDTASGEATWSIEAGGDPQVAVADDLALVTAGSELTAVDADGEEHWQAEGRGGTLLVVAGPERTVLLTSTGATIYATDATSGELLGEQTLVGPQSVMTISASTVGVTAQDGLVQLFDVDDLQPVATFEVPSTALYAGAVEGGYLIPSAEGTLAFHPAG